MKSVYAHRLVERGVFSTGGSKMSEAEALDFRVRLRLFEADGFPSV
jgi:hypothetical protein